MKYLLEISSSQENKNPGYFIGYNLSKSLINIVNKFITSLSSKLYSGLLISYIKFNINLKKGL